MPRPIPRWLRGLAASRAELSGETIHASPAERFELVCRLTAFALDCLRDQANRSGLTPGELRRAHERASNRLRARQA